MDRAEVPTSNIEQFGLFSDRMYSSTDLNRRAGEVLDHARKRPVTISRNKEQFALLTREHAAQLIQVANRFVPTLELVEGAVSVAEGQEPPPSFAWLKAFGAGGLRTMIHEVLAASFAALRDNGDWESVNAIVHEWRESALVASSGVLEEAMHSPMDETPLPDPMTLLESEDGVAPAS